MTLQKRDKRALIFLAVALSAALTISFWPQSSAVPVVAANPDSVEALEKRLARSRQTAASVPAMEATLEVLQQELASREKGLLETETSAQAQALMLQILRRVARGQAPPLEVRSVETGPVRAFGEDYGQALVTINFEAAIEQLVNLLADLASQPELLAAEEIRIGAGDPKQKLISVRLTVSGLVPRKLVPERKALF